MRQELDTIWKDWHHCHMENQTSPFNPSDPSSKIIGEAITFDDVLLIPQRSDFVPADADVRTRLTCQLPLN